MHVTMSDKELRRINVIQSVVESCMFFRYFTIIVGLQADGSHSCRTRPYHSLLEKHVLAGISAAWNILLYIFRPYVEDAYYLLNMSFRSTERQTPT